MQHGLALPELVVEGERRLVAVIALDEDHPGAALAGDAAQRVDQRGRDATAAPGLGHREVVDVDLAAFLLELLELVGDQPAGDVPADARDKDADVRPRQQPAQVGIAGRCALEGLAFVEGFPEQPVERADVGQVVGTELGNLYRQIVTAVPLTLTISIEPFWPSTS